MSEDGGGVEIESSGDALAAFAAEEDAPEADPKAEAKPEAKPEPKEAAPKAEAKPDRGEKEPEKKDEPPPKRKIKVKDEEVDEDEAAKGYLRGRDYTKKTQEIAAQRAKLEEFAAKVSEDPVAAYRLLGKSDEWIREKIGKAAYAFFADEVDPATGQPLTEEQKRLRVAERKLAEVEAEKQKAAEAQKQTEERQAREEAERHWVKTIVAHMEKVGAPKHILPRVAQHLANAIESDQTLDPADAIEDATALAWEDIESEHHALFDKMDFGALKAKFPGLVEKVRKGFVEEFKARRATPKPVEVEIPVEEKERREQTRRPMRTSRDVLRSFAG